MLTVTIKTTVIDIKQLEFEQTIIALLEKIEKSKECLGGDVFREINNGNTYYIETRWGKKEAMEKHLKSKSFKILIGTIHNLCDPPEGHMEIASLMEKIII